jgi:hypothetical protein
MGLKEQLKAGASLKRNTISFIDLVGSGSVSLGSGYAILNVQTSIPCRLRLYDSQASRDNAGEIIRPLGDTNISSSVALIGDFSMSSAGTYTVDPILYGLPDTADTFYRVIPSGPTITITSFLFDDGNYPPTPNTFYTLDNKRTLPEITGSLTSGSVFSGTIADSDIPKTYLLVSASLSTAAQHVRLRLYSTGSSISDAAELVRPFASEPQSSVQLIADMILSSSQVTYFSPKIVGANLETMGSNLILLRGDQTAIAGKNELYYVLENKLTGASNVTASVHVYSLED